MPLRGLAVDRGVELQRVGQQRARHADPGDPDHPRTIDSCELRGDRADRTGQPLSSLPEELEDGRIDCVGVLLW